jgi:hypothetical protein
MRLLRITFIADHFRFSGSSFSPVFKETIDITSHMRMEDENWSNWVIISSKSTGINSQTENWCKIVFCIKLIVIVCFKKILRPHLHLPHFQIDDQKLISCLRPRSREHSAEILSACIHKVW